MNLKEKFDLINLKEIHRYVEEGEQENVELEFKQANPNDFRGKQADQSNFAIALSGFSNSQGGIIVWGVEARRLEEQGLDCASKLRPFKNPKAFVSFLSKLESSIVSPGVPGVIHKAIVEKTDASVGYVKTFIPQNDLRPHMVHHNGENAYYRRYGDSFKKAQHYEVVEMFSRRLKPNLIGHFEFDLLFPNPNKHGHVLYAVKFFIENIGRATAKFPFIRITTDQITVPYYFGIDGNGTTGLKRKNMETINQIFYSGGSETVIFPKLKLEIDKICASVLVHSEPPYIEFLVAIACDETELKEYFVSVDFKNKKVASYEV